MSKRLWVAIGIGFLTACGGGGGGGTTGANPPPPPPPPLATPPGDIGFNIVDNAFVDPDGNRNQAARITMTAGQMAGWLHSGINTHTVTFNSAPNGAITNDSGNLMNGDTFLQTLTTPGTYIFHCSIHPDIMKGVTIIVN